SVCLHFVSTNFIWICRLFTSVWCGWIDCFRCDRWLKKTIEKQGFKGAFDFLLNCLILSQVYWRFLSSKSVQWINYVIPENGMLYEELSAGSSTFGVSQLPRCSFLVPFKLKGRKLEQLMAETRAIISSDDFGVILELSLKAVLDSMMGEFHTIFEGNTSGGIPLAKILPPVSRASTFLLEHPKKNKFINIIGNLPQVQSFYALVYANIGALSQ
ncbi:hypothetical protein KI387_011421, partial [Taxus chinensis]